MKVADFIFFNFVKNEVPLSPSHSVVAAVGRFLSRIHGEDDKGRNGRGICSIVLNDSSFSRIEEGLRREDQEVQRRGVGIPGLHMRLQKQRDVAVPKKFPKWHLPITVVASYHFLMQTCRGFKYCVRRCNRQDLDW